MRELTVRLSEDQLNRIDAALFFYSTFEEKSGLVTSAFMSMSLLNELRTARRVHDLRQAITEADGGLGPS